MLFNATQQEELRVAIVEGQKRPGFLPFKEVARSYFRPDIDVGRARIQDALTEGQDLVVQVEKDERGSKGAALTTFISLAGRYLVLMPNNPPGGGVCRSVEELQWDMNSLLQLGQAIDGAAKEPAQKPYLIYLESSLVIRAIRDYFQPDIGEILIDTEEIYDQA